MSARRDEAIDRLLHESRSAWTTGECPDAETLAAFAEGTLRGPARRGVEAHIADCHRCQMVTASMANVESTLGAWPDEVTETPGWRTTAKGWMIPAAVGVTAGALWLAVVDPRTPTPPVPVTDTPSQAANDDGLAAPQEAQELRDSRGDAGVAPETAQAIPAAAAPPPAPSAPTEAKREEAERFAQARPSADAPAATREARTDERPDSAPGAASSDITALRRSAPSNEADRTPAAAAEPPATPAPLAGAPSATGIAVQKRDASSFDITSPDPRVRWRVQAGLGVQRSNDGGVSWATQQTGLTSELTAGAAPAADVCWVVGRGGVVLRTTDGGRSWQRVKFPLSNDLTAVTASSALDATASLADGRRFRTMDGGAVWAPVP